MERDRMIINMLILQAKRAPCFAAVLGYLCQVIDHIDAVKLMWAGIKFLIIMGARAAADHIGHFCPACAAVG